MRKSGQNTPLFKDRSADQHTLMGFRGIGQKRAAGEAGPAVALLGDAVPLCVCFHPAFKTKYKPELFCQILSKQMRAREG